MKFKYKIKTRLIEHFFDISLVCTSVRFVGILAVEFHVSEESTRMKQYRNTVQFNVNLFI